MKFSKDTITHLDIFLGNKCNLRCIACDCWLYQNHLSLSKEILWTKVGDAIEYVEMNCSKFDKLMLIGGEPFVQPGLSDFLLNQRYTTYIVIYTNFSIPLSAYIWPDNVHFITSLDAPDEETYRKIRRTKAFSTTMKNINQNLKWMIHFDTTVSKLNIDKLDQIVKVTQGSGCTHWFFPVDPRVLRYFNSHKDEKLAKISARRIWEILLTPSDLPKVESFYQRNKGYSLMNDFTMFKGIYFAGFNHYYDLEEYTETISPEYVDRSKIDNCPASESYLEITFDFQGNYIPILHCPKLQKKLVKSSVPSFSNLYNLIDWISEEYKEIKCDSFCGRTQFLGIDEFKSLFSEVKLKDEG